MREVHYNSKGVKIYENNNGLATYWIKDFATGCFIRHGA